jgi:hypothetical protein
MKRGSEYNWSSITTLDAEEFSCGYCGAKISSNEGYSGWKQIGPSLKMPIHIYVCHTCANPTFFDFRGEQTPKQKEKPVSFSEPVQQISPKFVEIYNQAHLAESQNLNEIAGPGYGKALEFLIKDYLIKKLPTEEATIKSLSLYNCIDQKLDNPKIKALADKARVVRNDETHYERKYEQSDVNDLKKLINATASWIDLESYTAEVTKEE